MTKDIAQANIERYDLQLPAQRYGYQPQDWEIVDYQQKQFLKTPVYFRSSPLDEPADIGGRPRVAMIGAAQILGRFCPVSLPDIITATTPWVAQNYGYSGASPGLFLGLGGEFFKRLNACDAVVVQIMSGRAAPNARFKVPNPLLPNMVQVEGKPENLFINNAWNELLDTLTAREFAKAVTQTRNNYVRHMTQLLSLITTRKILLWYSDRDPNYEMSFMNWKGVLGEFPHMVNGAMVQQLVPLADAYVETVSLAGRPHQLINRFTHQPIQFYPTRPDPTENYYYPTPEMHQLAADKLTPVLKGFKP